MTATHYPEIESAGGLTPALNSALKNVGSSLRISMSADQDNFPLTYARIEKDGKFSQVYLASEKKLYLPDFWRNGVCLANGETDNLELLAECVNYWLNQNIMTIQLADKFDFVSPNKASAIYDEGNEVEFKWKSILNDPHNQELKSFIKLAISDPTLSKLFPYKSLTTLCLSRCTGYPFTYDTPTVTPIFETDQFLVRTSEGEEIGQGPANIAFKLVINNLPENIGPAVTGTSETIRKCI